MELKPLARGQVTLVSNGLDAIDRSLTGVTVTEDLTSAIATSLERHADPHVAIVPEGPYVIPVYQESVI